jgi:hypothetical protein
MIKRGGVGGTAKQWGVYISLLSPPARNNASPMCLRVVDALFDDKRFITVFLTCWLCLVLVVFKDIGLLDTKFMTLGPSSATVFMGVTLDSWYKWGLVAAFTFINTSVNDFMSDALGPWILNTITDHKSRYIPYPKWVCLAVTQTWSMYCNIMSVFSIFLAMSQIDFVLIRMVADLMVNAYTTTKFMRNKSYCQQRLPAGDVELCEQELERLDTDTTPLKKQENTGESSV